MTLVETFAPQVDTHYVEDALRRGEESLRRVPPHFQAAEVTVPEVALWTKRLVAFAVRRKVPNVLVGPSLLLLGPVGTGKTYQAYGAVRLIVQSGAYCQWRFTTAADLYAQLRPRSGVDSEAVFREFADVKLLVLDDLGAAKSSEWVEEINYRLVNHRYEHELPTLITSNVSPRHLTEYLGERVASRLAEMTTRVVLDGSDRRRVKKESS